MHHFYLPPAQCQGATLLLTGGEAHHALHVLRVRRGEKVSVLDGAGHACDCAVQAPERDGLPLEVLARRSLPPPPCQLTLAQAIPKGKLIESIIQKATELGIYRIAPLISHRTVVKLENRDADQKLAKWRSVAVEAVKQSGSAWLPRIEPPRTIEQFLSEHPRFELALFGSLRGERRHPRVYFDAFKQEHERKPASVCVAIGPEGDFSAEEVEAFHLAGALPITLGPLILRTDTAAVYCMSILNYELQSG